MHTSKTHLLSSRVLEFGSSKSFNNVGLVLIVRTNRHNWLTDVDSCNETLRFPISASHSGLKSGKFIFETLLHHNPILFKKIIKNKNTNKVLNFTQILLRTATPFLTYQRRHTTTFYWFWWRGKDEDELECGIDLCRTFLQDTKKEKYENVRYVQKNHCYKRFLSKITNQLR